MIGSAFDLTGRNAIVTGGANGIGRGIAEALAGAGANVLVTARSDRPAARDTVEALRAAGAEAHAIMLDAGEDDAVERLFAEAESVIGPVSILVNNAAMAARTPFLDMGRGEYDRTLDVNLRFPFFTLQRFARALISRGEQGSAINVSSISAFKAISKLSAYQCSKAGISMLTQGAAYELAPYGIRVNTLSPGLTATKANKDQWQDNPALWAERGRNLPLGRAGAPRDYAGAAVFLASGASEWMTGADLVVDGGDAVI